MIGGRTLPTFCMRHLSQAVRIDVLSLAKGGTISTLRSGSPSPNVCRRVLNMVSRFPGYLLKWYLISEQPDLQCICSRGKKN